MSTLVNTLAIAMGDEGLLSPNRPAGCSLEGMPSFRFVQQKCIFRATRQPIEHRRVIPVAVQR